MEPTLGQDAGNTVDMTTKDSEYEINIADEAAAECEGLDPSSDGRLLWAQCRQTALHVQRNRSRKGEPADVAGSVLSYLKNVLPQPSAATTLVCQRPLAPGQAPPAAERCRVTESPDDGEHFLDVRLLHTEQTAGERKHDFCTHSNQNLCVTRFMTSLTLLRCLELDSRCLGVSRARSWGSSQS